VTYNNNNKQADPDNLRNTHIPGKETLRECPNIFSFVSKTQHRLFNSYNLETHEKWRLFFPPQDIENPIRRYRGQ